MQWFWTWGGKCFGYREGDNLWTYDGHHVGRFHEDEVYDPDGHYLGEIRNNNRLISNTSKKSWRRGRFGRHGSRGERWCEYLSRTSYSGLRENGRGKTGASVKVEQLKCL
jgi:hypothetical protein